MTRRRRLILATAGILIVAAIALTRQEARNSFVMLEFSAEPLREDAGARQEVLRVLHREAASKLEVLELRDFILPAARARVSAAQPFDFMVTGTAATPELEARMRNAVSQYWRSLSITQPLVPVVSVLSVDTARVRNDYAEYPGSQIAFALPAPGTNQPCVAVLRVVLPHRRQMNFMRPIEQRAPELLGACAYYAAFGEPGTGIREWLASREFDLARGTDWTGSLELRPRQQRALWYIGVHPLTNWLNFNLAARQASPVFLRCADGERSACAHLVLDSTLRAERARTRADRPNVVSTRPDTTPLPSGLSWNAIVIDEFLAGVVRSEGRQRFQQFWKSDQPPAQAFQSAFGEPLDVWTARWTRYVVGPTKRATHTTPLTVLVMALFVTASLLAGFRIADRRTAA